MISSCFIFGKFDESDNRHRASPSLSPPEYQLDARATSCRWLEIKIKKKEIIETDGGRKVVAREPRMIERDLPLRPRMRDYVIV